MPGREKYDMDRRAFTIIELLVVIAIVAVLLAVLLPTLSKARRSAQATQCAAQLRQLGQAFHLYGTENNDLLTWGVLTFFASPVQGQQDLSWDDQLSKYTGIALNEEERLSMSAPRDTSILRCPSDSVEIDLTGFSLPSPTFKRSYSMPHVIHVSGFQGKKFLGIGGQMATSDVNTPWGAIGPYLCVKRTSARAASETILLAERPVGTNVQGSGLSALLDNPRDQGIGWQPAWSAMAQNKFVTLHSGRWNYLFVDGHVQSLHPIDTVRSSTSPIVAAAQSNYMWTRDPAD